MTNDIKARAPRSINASYPQKCAWLDLYLEQTHKNLKVERVSAIAVRERNKAKGAADQAAYKRLHLFSIKRCHRFGPIGMHGKTADE